LDEYFAYIKKKPDALLDFENVDGINQGTCGAFFAFKPQSPISDPKDMSLVGKLNYSKQFTNYSYLNRMLKMTILAGEPHSQRK
jgi:hypothetical protein